MSRFTGLHLTTALATLVLSAACSSSDVKTASTGPGSTVPGAGATSTGGGAAPGGGASSSVPGGGQSTSVPGGGQSTSSSGGAGGASTAANGGSGNSGGALVLPTPTNNDHCLYGYSPEPTDDTMASGPVRFSTPQGDDSVLQPEVLKWMDDNKWTGAHVIWHAVRGCVDGSAAGLLGPLGYPNICKDYPVLVPADQNCKTVGDGYQFLLFHRHMLQDLKQLWPKHAADFDGFPTFPKTKADLPDIWNTADPTWSAQVLAAAKIFDDIEHNLDKFPTEGDLGFALQCPTGTPLLAGLKTSAPYIGIHFDMHNQWSRGASSAHGLNNGQVNVTNYMFWKLHGWIDNIWEKYRVAKGITADAAAMEKYKADFAQSCNEMDIEEAILKQTPGSGPVLDCPPDVDETGTFHTMVRPIFESTTNHCASCHGPSQSSPYAGLTLGGQVSSKCIVQRLLRPSSDGGQFPLVTPGDPEKSYLYLKASGLADGAGCVSNDTDHPCNTATMPPGGKTMTDADLKLLHDWIAAGANYP